MDIKIRLTFAVIVFFIVIGINGCGKIGLGCADTKFTFQTSIRAYPNKDSIRIGDTVWFEATIPTSLVDIGTKQFIDYSGAANMGTYLSIDRLTGGSIADPGGLPAAKEFRYLLINGIELNNVLPERNKEYQFLEMNKQYSLKFGIIAQKKEFILQLLVTLKMSIAIPTNVLKPVTTSILKTLNSICIFIKMIGRDTK